MLKIEILKRVRTTADGRNFDTYKAVEKSGKLVDLKFTKDVKNMPNESGFIYVENDKINLSNKSKYPVYWVKGVSRYEEYDKSKTDLSNAFEEV